MVRKCISCLKPWKLSANRSFHGFPREIMQHNIWLQNLGLCEEDIVKVKNALVCSDHFSSVDVSEYASAGRIRLKFNAIPKSVSKNIVLDSMQKKIHSSSSTLTASSFEYSEKKLPCPKKRTYNQLCFFCDCHTSDMSSPTRAKKVPRLAKTEVKRQRRKISALQRQRSRLKSKITSLKSLLTHFRENQYISSSAESVVEWDESYMNHARGHC